LIEAIAGEIKAAQAAPEVKPKRHGAAVARADLRGVRSPRRRAGQLA